MRILWLSNRSLSKDNGKTGTWLLALSRKLAENENIILGNISIGSDVSTKNNNWDNINEWLIPSNGLNQGGLPNSKLKTEVNNIISDFKPDLIHVWGVENFWGALTMVLAEDIPVLLEIQGLKGEIAPVYYGGLNFWDKVKCFHLRELLTFKSIFSAKKKFEKWGKIEKSIIANHQFISTHSKWAEAKVKDINPHCEMFKNERLLRNEFYSTSRWEENGNKIIFTSLGYPAPFKGLFSLIKTFEKIVKRHPEAKLKIAGGFHLKGIKMDGYIRFITKEIEKRNLQNNIKWLGGLNSKGIIDELKESSISVFPSFNESYGQALAESMLMGVPTVASFNGGYSYLGKDEETILFYPAGDIEMCSLQIERLWKDKSLSESLSKNSRNFILKNNDPNKIFNKQVEIYKKLIK